MRLVVLFVAEALVFLMATLNVRACAKGRVVATLSTDAAIAGLNFVLIRKVADAQSTAELVVYTAGAVVGSAIGMYVTRHWTEA
jgi:FtsH-binding integral membrane protein